jgi:hypothetical protein
MCSLSAPRCMGLLPRAEFSNHGLTHILRRAARTGRICVQNPAKRPFCVQMSEHMTVIHSAGGAELRAAVTPGTDRGWAAIVCHPWGKLGGDMNNPVVVSLRNGLAKRGLTVCRYVPPLFPVFQRTRVFTEVWWIVVCVAAVLLRVSCATVMPGKLRVRKRSKLLSMMTRQTFKTRRWVASFSDGWISSVDSTSEGWADLLGVRVSQVRKNAKTSKVSAGLHSKTFQLPCSRLPFSPFIILSFVRNNKHGRRHHQQEQRHHHHHHHHQQLSTTTANDNK